MAWWLAIFLQCVGALTCTVVVVGLAWALVVSWIEERDASRRFKADRIASAIAEKFKHGQKATNEIREILYREYVR